MTRRPLIHRHRSDLVALAALAAALVLLSAIALRANAQLHLPAHNPAH